VTPPTADDRAPSSPPRAVLALRGVGVRYDGRAVLRDVDWEVWPGQRWVVLGRNGSGKSTLVRIASGYQHPSTGEAFVLGEQLGRTDVRRLRPRIGLASASLSHQLRPHLSAADVVMTARFGALEPWWHTYDDDDRRRARTLLGRVGCAPFAERAYGSLSSGERQRVLLARTLMTDPELLLLDEPTAGLDLRGREELVATLAALADDSSFPPSILVTHHVDEIPPGTTHALLLGEGEVLAAGPIDAALTAPTLSACFGLELVLERHDDRWTARATRPAAAALVGEGLSGPGRG